MEADKIIERNPKVLEDVENYPELSEGAIASLKKDE